VKALRAKPQNALVALLAVVAVCVGTGLLFAGCAGELPVKGQTTSTEAGSSTTTTISQTTALGRQVASTWQEAVQKLLPLLQGTPPAASIQQQVADLKEQYVQKLVALGRQIRALPSYEQQSVYDRANDILASLGGTDWFTSYKELYDTYANLTDQQNQDFAVLLSTFNTLTEYAFFDVLKAQDPAEATRLSVE
jgi:hypothetical protein